MKLSAEFAQLIFWLCVASCAFAQVAILISTSRALRAPGPGATEDATGARMRPLVRRAPEMLWAVLPAIVLAFVLAGTWKSVSRISGADVPPTHQHPPATIIGSPTQLAENVLPPRRVHAESKSLSKMVQQVMDEQPNAETAEAEELHLYPEELRFQ